MFDLRARMRSAAAASLTAGTVFALAILGAVWLSIAAVTWLSRHMSTDLAMALIGVVSLTPFAIMLIRNRAGAARGVSPEQRAALTAQDEAREMEAVAIAQLARTAESVAEKAPLAGAGLALAAGLVAARSPQTLAVAAQVIGDVVAGFAASRGRAEETPPVKEGG